LNVEFQESQGDGLDQIDFVSFDVEDPVEMVVSCDGRCEQQRQDQRSIMMSIFGHFEIPFDGSKHECLFEGINCNDEDLVTHIWLSKNGDYDLSGKSIPASLFNLPFLRGLFLGGNRLIGSLPIDIGTSNNDLRMLWLQDNDLTGQIPTRIGNLPLRELNMHGNKLTGTLPAELGKLSKLRLLNLGKNELIGTIPLDFFNKSVSPDVNNPPCRIFRNAVEKLRLAWLSEVDSASNTQFLS